MPFLSEAIMRPYKGDKWQMVEPLDYRTEDGEFIRVPVGFVHDLASVPRVLNIFFRKHGHHTNAAILHDWGYYKKGHVAKGVKLSRSKVDKLFLEAMKASGVGYFQRKMMYYAVRLGGFVAWAT